MLDDRTLIARCRAGQRDMSDILVDRYKKQLYSFCWKLTGNRGNADDLFQDTWVKAIHNIHQCDLDKKFINWLFTICINLYRDRYRKYFRWLKVVKSYLSSEQMETDMEQAESSEPRPDQRAEKDSREDTVRKALASLKDMYRVPLLLYYYRQFTLEEIGEILGTPGGTIKSRLSAGRKQLKNLLEADHERT